MAVHLVHQLHGELTPVGADVGSGRGRRGMTVAGDELPEQSSGAGLVPPDTHGQIRGRTVGGQDDRKRVRFTDYWSRDDPDRADFHAREIALQIADIRFGGHLPAGEAADADLGDGPFHNLRLQTG